MATRSLHCSWQYVSDHWPFFSYVCLSVCPGHKCMSSKPAGWIDSPRDARSGMSGPWLPTPCRFVLIVRARVYCFRFNPSFAGSLNLTKSGPSPSHARSRCSITRSRTSAQEVEWCCSSAIRSTCFRLWSIQSTWSIAPFSASMAKRGPTMEPLVLESIYDDGVFHFR